MTADVGSIKPITTFTVVSVIEFYEFFSSVVVCPLICICTNNDNIWNRKNDWMWRGSKPGNMFLYVK